MRRVSCTSTYQSVSYAIFLSVSPSDFQKRDRDKRTYQFERSSQNVSTRRTNFGESKSSSAPEHCAISFWVLARIHRSSGRALAQSGPLDTVANCGVKPSMFA